MATDTALPVVVAAAAGAAAVAAAAAAETVLVLASVCFPLPLLTTHLT